MKQLTKEQHFEVFTWLVKTAGCTLAKQFEQDFPPSCCDSCADGEHCKSEPITISREDYQTTVKKVNGIIKDSRI
jgi:hypothetical protein